MEMSWTWYGSIHGLDWIVSEKMDSCQTLGWRGEEKGKRRDKNGKGKILEEGFFSTVK